MNFNLHPKLEQDSIFIADLELCQLRLINNTDYPWLILIPRLPDITEITDLKDADFIQLNKEIMQISRLLKSNFRPDKLNIASIGNVVAQMHVHIVARFKEDKTYPGTVWGYECTNYPPNTAHDIVDLIQRLLVKTK